jgi:hypothetical protein
LMPARRMQSFRREQRRSFEKRAPRFDSIGLAQQEELHDTVCQGMI